MMEKTKAIEDVLAERRRQIEVEGFDAEHDNQNKEGELARASAAYALAASFQDWYRPIGIQRYINLQDSLVRRLWPSRWEWELFKPTNRRRDLVKSVALGIAAIEQIDRDEHNAGAS